jgi:membrane fusion protein, multidrug efflux system
MRIAFMALAGVLVGGAPAAAIELDAVLDWARRVELGTPVSGTVARVHVQAGDRVPRNQPLLELDQRPFVAHVERAQAELDKAVPLREEAARERGRAEELYDRGVLANHELDLALVADARAEAEHRAAQAALAQARLDLEYSTLRAPFDAWVVRREAEIGQAVVTRLQPMTLVVLAEAARMTARAHVAQETLAGLEAGQRLTVRVAGDEHEGRVTRLGLEPVTGWGADALYALEVEIRLDPAERLRAGQVATIVLP